KLSDRMVADCEQTKAKPEKTFALSLLKCSGVDRDNCAAVKESSVSINERSGRVVFDDLDPRQYLLEFRFRQLPPLRRTIGIRKFDQVIERFPIECSTLFGRITVGGMKPEGRMRIDFGWNGPQSAIADAGGEYFAVVEKPPAKDRVIRLR